MLLSDANVSRFLDQNFVLYWNTVRPAPKATACCAVDHLFCWLMLALRSSTKSMAAGA